MQAIFDNYALDKLPLVRLAITQADNFESNQMRQYALREICNSKISLDQMNQEQIHFFSRDLIKVFEEKNWIKGK